MITNLMRMGVSLWILTLLAAQTANAQQYADSSSPVAWAPSYSGSCIDCKLSGQSMSYWSMEGANFPGADVSKAHLLGVKAAGANFSDTHAQSVNFRNAILEGANFARADLRDAILIGVSANTANFASANATGANLSSAQLIGSTFTAVIARNIRADHANFSGANVSGTIFDEAWLRGTNFDGATLYGASLKGADVAGASFRDARMGEANLAGMTGFDSADFSGACGSVGTLYPPGMSLPLCGGGIVLRLGQK